LLRVTEYTIIRNAQKSEPRFCPPLKICNTASSLMQAGKVGEHVNIQLLSPILN
jgi:hypothetical protein